MWLRRLFSFHNMLHFFTAVATTPLADLSVRPPSDRRVPPSEESGAHGHSRQTILIRIGTGKTPSDALLVAGQTFGRVSAAMKLRLERLSRKPNG